MRGLWYRHRFDLALAPSRAEGLAMVRRLVAELGERGAAQCLGCSHITVRGWLADERPVSSYAVRALWLLESLRFHPWRLQSWFDLMTWGRFAVPPPAPRDGESWSDWSI